MSSARRNLQITETTLLQLKDILSLIKPKQTVFDESKSKDIIALYQQCQNHILDYHKIDVHQRVYSNIFSNFEPRFVQLIRHCVFTHDWTNVLKLVHALIKEGSRMADTIWKAGLTALMMENRPKLIDQYVRHLYKIPRFTCTEVLLDYLLYLIIQGDFDTANQLTEYRKAYYVHVSEEETDDHRENVKLLFIAYQGLSQYLEWKTAIKNEKSPDADADFVKAMLTDGVEVKSSKVIADKARTNLSCLKSTSGVWDIFILKLVEILEHYGETDSIKELLTEYKAKNPNNLNAHRYLYKFEMKCNAETEQTIKNLKNVVKLDPCNPLAIELYSHLVTCLNPEAIVVIFNYLDFHHHRDNIVVWQRFESHLSRICLNESSTDKDEINIVKTCWSSRKDWWPKSVLQTDVKSPGFNALENLKAKVQVNLKKLYRLEVMEVT